MPELQRLIRRTKPIREQLIESPRWYLALHLWERFASLEGGRVDPERLTGGLGDVRMRRWSEDGADPVAMVREALGRPVPGERDIELLFAEKPAQLAARCEVPAWLAALLTAFRRSRQSNCLLSPRPDRPSTILVWPLLEQAVQRLRQQIVESVGGEATRSPIQPNSAPVLVEPLLDRVEMILSPSFVLELNVARLQGALPGRSPHERFRYFWEQMREPDAALSLLERYPVAARLAVLCIEDWVNAIHELIQRLVDDWSRILAEFGAGVPRLGVLQDVTPMGDVHPHGRCVLLLRFTGGVKLIYKPRPLAAEQLLQDLLKWLDARLKGAHLRTMHIVDQGDYGWMQYAEPQGCQTLAQVLDFFWRQGVHLALLYVLGATDCHAENVIASGEHPILVDAECIFHYDAAALAATDGDVVRSLTSGANCVLQVGMLPYQFLVQENSPGVDVSGFGGLSGQMTPVEVDAWLQQYTDEMHSVRVRMELPPTNNRPHLQDRVVDALDYEAQIAAGFRAAYRILADHGGSLLQEMDLANRPECTVRCIMRPTVEYLRLIRGSVHPYMMRDSLERDRWLDGGLRRPLRDRPGLHRVMALERHALERCEIPFFQMRLGATDLWTSEGVRISGILRSTPITVARERIQRLAESDLIRQHEVIHSAFRAARLNRDSRLEYPRIYPSKQPPSEALPSREELQSEAEKIGERLGLLALRETGLATWVGVTSHKGKSWNALPIGPDLYEGLAGIALFLGYLEKFTRRKHFEELARSTVATMWSMVERRAATMPIGAFNGLAGVAYVLIHLGSLWSDEDLLSRARRVAGMIEGALGRDHEVDVMLGTSGAAVSLASAYRCCQDEAILRVAARCVRYTLDRHKEMARGIGWRSGDYPRPLGGFGHGAAGIAWSLGEVAALTGDARLDRYAARAVEYETSLYSARHKNWRDVRNLEQPGLTESRDDGNYMSYWCHGAMGIGLSRIRMFELTGDHELLPDVQAALESTRACGFGRNHCLCHGDLGNIELWHKSSAVLADKSIQQEAEGLAARTFSSIRRGWVSGLPRGVETPGLMMGLAGIGWGLLRLSVPNEVPSLLLLEPPRRRGACA